ncbi:membrane protein insertion efficiency factor YidD [Thermodesulfatator atlanticus]|uniref:membrane protein insertion efficiency factor YidD n=1 Tax=Thermodesulfatator atlanticus TaxID=501497 RepID=UPI0003B3D181|nr:membrane protein insertion efficiency factor YidD [Thermodesulfatator atlanticus]
MKKIALIIIKSYQIFVSPLFPSTCRFYPCCSQYALEVFARHGIFKGILLTLWRLMRCHPLCRGGYDPPPEKFPSPWKKIKSLKESFSWTET